MAVAAGVLAELDRALELDPKYEPAMINRVAFKGMEEGRPLAIKDFIRTDFSREQLEREKLGDRQSGSSCFSK